MTGETVSDNRSSNLNMSVSGDYWITFTATDPSGNEGTETRKVTVKNKAWDYFQKILASDGAAGDEFGWSVAIDGDYAIVGAYVDNSTTADFDGSAYIFHRTGTNTWDSGYKISGNGGGENFGLCRHRRRLRHRNLSDITAIIASWL